MILMENRSRNSTVPIYKQLVNLVRASVACGESLEKEEKFSHLNGS